MDVSSSPWTPTPTGTNGWPRPDLGPPSAPTEPEVEVRPLHDKGQLTQAVLVEHQVTEPGLVAMVYAAVRDGQDITLEGLQSGGWELKRRCNRVNAMHINPDKVLTLEVADCGRTRQVSITPTELQRAIMWDVRQQTHAGGCCD